MLLKDLEAVSSNRQQATNYVSELESQLKEKQTYISQLSENIRGIESNFNQQLNDRETALDKVKSALQNCHFEIENLQKFNAKIIK